MPTSLDEPRTPGAPVVKRTRLGETFIGALVSVQQRDVLKRDEATGDMRPVMKTNGKARQELVLTLITMPGTTAMAGIGDSTSVPEPGDKVRLILRGQAFAQWLEAKKDHGGLQTGDVVTQTTDHGQAYDGQGKPSGPKLTTQAELDAADAARLVSFGLQPKLQPARDQEYGELLRRYREDPAFARLADAVATGLGLVVLEVSPRAGMAVTAAEDSVFAVRMGDYARRTSADSVDRFLHGLAHLAVAAMAFPRPEDLADDGYIGRVSVHGVEVPR